MSQTSVTVALFTCHRAWMLADALASLDRMNSDETFIFEILVVDNASQESTRQLVARFAATACHPIRFVCEQKPGLSCARNRAIRETNAEWIAFFDDDQLAEPDWLCELMQLAREKDCRLVGGTLRLRLPEENPIDFGPVCRNLLGEFVGGPEPQMYTRTFSPGFGHVLVHRSLFEDIGDFDEQLVAGGEDFDVYNRIRAARITGWYCPAAIAYHVIPRARIQKQYMRWTALRQGGHVARREQNGRGKAAVPIVAAGRLAQAATHVARLAWHWFRRDTAAMLDVRCRLWRSEGYLRQTLHDALPHWFGQREFFASLNFREGRQRLADSKG